MNRNKYDPYSLCDWYTPRPDHFGVTDRVCGPSSRADGTEGSRQVASKLNIARTSIPFFTVTKLSYLPPEDRRIQI